MRKFFTLIGLVLALGCQAQVITGKVIRVADGDTITILDGNKIKHKARLAGIDAPEKAQAFGERSRESLADLVAGRTVILETHKKDRYGRAVGKILVNGRDINVEQVRRGMAWFYRDYSNEQTVEDRLSYDRAEAEAKGSRLWLWADRDPVPPWEYRRRK